MIQRNESFLLDLIRWRIGVPSKEVRQEELYSILLISGDAGPAFAGKASSEMKSVHRGAMGSQICHQEA